MNNKKKLGFGSILFMTRVYIFLYLPIVVVIVYSFNSGASNLQFEGLSLTWYKQVLGGDPLWTNMALSLKLAFVSMVISVGLGTLATIGTYRYEFRLKKYINGLLYIPMVILDLVIGLASLATFTKMGLSFGFSTLVFAHVTFCLPYVVVTLRARIADFDHSIEERAMDLGANQWRTLKRVTLPLLAPGIISGAFMSISLSIDDVVISYFVSGAGDLTFPMKVYGMIRSKITTKVYVVSTLFLIGVIVAYLLGKIVQKMWEKKHAI